MKLSFKICCLFLAITCFGCATAKLPATFEIIPDYQRRPLKKIAVLPPMLSLSTLALSNFEDINSLPDDEETCRVIYPVIIRLIQQKKYAYLDPQEMAAIFEKNNLYNIQQVYAVDTKELGRLLAVDAILYFYIVDISSIFNVNFVARMQDTKDGTVLWSSLCNVPQRKGMAGGVAGGIGGAIGAGLSLFGPFAAAGGALVGSKVDSFIYSKFATLEGKIKEAMVSGFTSLPKCPIKSNDKI